MSERPTPETDALYLEILQWAQKFPTGTTEQNIERAINTPQSFKDKCGCLERERDEALDALRRARPMILHTPCYFDGVINEKCAACMVDSILANTQNEPTRKMSRTQ